MSVEELERINDEGLAAWDAGDAEAFVGLFANDFVWIDWTQPAPRHEGAVHLDAAGKVPRDRHRLVREETRAGDGGRFGPAVLQE